MRRLTTLIAIATVVAVMATAVPVMAQDAHSLQQTFISIAKKLKPSVVNIRVTREEKARVQGQDPFGGPDGTPFDDLFEKFFRGPRGRQFKAPHRSFKSEAAGSGIIVDAAGHILTNNHVVKGATKIAVKLSTGKEVDATIVGRDPQTDLAVIKLKGGETVHPAEFADTSKLEVGQWVMAIGNPFGLEQTVTVGVLSAIGRSGLGAAPIEDFLQTDASINPGNSGGPLCDLDGKVIGVNTLIFAAPGSGIGFAIPANMAQRITQQIIKGGSVDRPYIGISMQPVTPDLQEHLGLSDRAGAVVMDVQADSPGGKAGLKQMDIIRSIDGKEMKDTNDVQKYVLQQNVGATINLDVMRNGKNEKVVVKLEQMPKTYGLADFEDQADASESDSPADGKKDKDGSAVAEQLGLSLQPLTKELAEQLGTKQSSGLVVTGVTNDGPADEAGVTERDVITQVNAKPVANLKDLVPAFELGKAKKSHLLVVQRGNSPLFLVVKTK